MEQINPGLIGRLLISQELVGSINGVNTVFSTPRLFLHAGVFLEAVYMRGQRVAEGLGKDYIVSESGGIGAGFDTITFVEAPRTDDARPLIDYYPASA